MGTIAWRNNGKEKSKISSEKIGSEKNKGRAKEKGGEKKIMQILRMNMTAAAED